MEGPFFLLIPAVSVIAVFTFVSIATWSDNRRKEREAYYKHETYKKLIEQPGESAEAVRGFLHDEALREWQRRRDGLRLGGMITLVVGIGVMIFLYGVTDGQENVYLVGLIPALIGFVLLLFGMIFIQRPEQLSERNDRRR